METTDITALARDLAPTGVLRASINHADLCFLAIEPAREAEIAFTPPYVHIEGVYAVPAEPPLRTPDDVDRPGVRIGVKQGSAYDLYLTRTLRHATVVRGPEGWTSSTPRNWRPRPESGSH
ncbi:transporter substrate-binding domain-containing protein [Streptomyces violaceusniger]|uniref:Uncharacterized protein n=1 Tax=Streptomyces violaceusniger TaxID=68280 RepID=A0A4D4KYP4_STRVO|nr:hypothetical protein SVIO_022800 [Streptomyces violaceusniger]